MIKWPVPSFQPSAPLGVKTTKWEEHGDILINRDTFAPPDAEGFCFIGELPKRVWYKEKERK